MTLTSVWSRHRKRKPQIVYEDWEIGKDAFGRTMYCDACTLAWRASRAVATCSCANVQCKSGEWRVGGWNMCRACATWIDGKPYCEKCADGEEVHYDESAFITSKNYWPVGVLR